MALGFGIALLISAAVVFVALLTATVTQFWATALAQLLARTASLGLAIVALALTVKGMLRLRRASACIGVLVAVRADDRDRYTKSAAYLCQ